MLVSIVIPAYNAARFLSRTAAGVASQTVTSWECIIVDDGSSDDTFAVASTLAAADSRFRVVGQANRGVAEARNRGLAESNAASDFVIFLDHDDVWLPDCLERLVGALKLCPDAPASHGLAAVWPEQATETPSAVQTVRHRDRLFVDAGKLSAAGPDDPTSAAMLVWDNCITTVGCVLFRRTALSGISPVFDPAMAPLDDWDLYFRIAAKRPILFVDHVVIRWHLHATNTSSAQAAMDDATCRVRRGMLRSGTLTPGEEAVVRERLSRMTRTSLRHGAERLAREATVSVSRRNLSDAVRLWIGAAREYGRYLFSLGGKLYDSES